MCCRPKLAPPSGESDDKDNEVKEKKLSATASSMEPQGPVGDAELKTLRSALSFLHNVSSNNEVRTSLSSVSLNSLLSLSLPGILTDDSDQVGYSLTLTHSNTCINQLNQMI
jgi:hypothetical protein